MNKNEEKVNLPERVFKAGSIRASIWRNPVVRENGEESDFLSIRLERSFKNKNNEWQSTNSFRVSDLPKAELVLNKAYEYIIVSQD